MINKLLFHLSDTLDPYVNLAKEKYLFDTVEEGTCLLYLWQNQNTVVIGKNQNAYAECRVRLLTEENGKLARRLSGGGAVFHDIGNLNFTFICSTPDFDLSRHMQVIKSACESAGIDAEISGRNDVLADGRKFSGNAFYHSAGRSYHHGTILISADMKKMQRYLTPPTAKLEAKGVKSVRSRVLNLNELSPDLTPHKMRAHLLSAFDAVYGLTAKPYAETDEKKVDSLARTYSSWEYLFGTPLPFNVTVSGRLPFGSIELQMQVTDGTVKTVRAYTDALDVDLAPNVEAALIGVSFKTESIRNALSKTLADDIAAAITSFFDSQIF